MVRTSDMLDDLDELSVINDLGRVLPDEYFTVSRLVLTCNLVWHYKEHVLIMVQLPIWKTTSWGGGGGYVRGFYLTLTVHPLYLHNDDI